MGHHYELHRKLKADGIVNEFWMALEHLSPQLNEHFIAPNLGEWNEVSSNFLTEYGLLPGDILVIKQDQKTIWDWQHAGMIKDEKTVYSAMYTETVMEQPIDYYKHYATRIRALRVIANHDDPALGCKACEVAEARLGNTYGISDKWYALHHKKAPMYCSLVPWFSWMVATGINLDSSSPDFDEITNEQWRLRHLSNIPHAIVYPGNLADSCEDYPEHRFRRKTECVLDLCRPGYEDFKSLSS